MATAANPVMETARLVLRPMGHADAGALLEVWGDAQAMRFYPHPYSRAEVEEFIARNLARYAADGHSLWTVVLRATGEVVGDCGPVIQQVEGRDEVEIGYHLVPRFWGHGYAAEAARASRDWAFRNRGCARVISLVRPENLPSQGVARRNGMTIASRVFWHGFDHEIWSIAREKWAAESA